MEFCRELLSNFYRVIDWNEQDCYSNLDLFSTRILDFSHPKALSLSVSKEISPQLKSTYTLGSKSENCVGYLYTSCPVKVDQNYIPSKPIDPNQLKNEGVAAEKNILMYGRVFDDFRVEGIYINQLKRNLMMVCSGQSFWRGEESNLQFQVLKKSKRTYTEFSYNTDNHIFGCSTLYRFNPSIVAGAELYYTDSEKSGGLSVGTAFTGARQNGMNSVMTLIANPIMGHFESSFGTTLTEYIRVATRYDFNMYSFDSDLSLGVEYKDPLDDQVLRAKVSLINVLFNLYRGLH